MNATVSTVSIEVQHSVRPDVGREFLTIKVPNGWDDVKKITSKVLEYDGRAFVFTAWNSDRLDCHFARALDGSWPKVATIKRR